MEKKHLFSLALLSAISSCHTDEQIDSKNLIDGSSLKVERKCASTEVFEERLKISPDLKSMYMSDIHDELIMIDNNKNGKVTNNGTIVIPIVVNVVYSKSESNLSYTRILSQEEVLNNAFASTNFDIGKVPNLFKSVKAGNINIRFVVVDVKKRKVSRAKWNAGADLMKTATYGIAGTNPKKYLNVWIVDSLGEGNLGYSSFPVEHGRWNDGIVIPAVYFGVNHNNVKYGLGRTMVHEVGHYLGLLHTWGDSMCGTDYIHDTPQQKEAIDGRPGFPYYTTCGNVRRVAMTMNFMNYADDHFMYMFTMGQRNRMEYVVSANGRRKSLRAN